MKKLFLFAAMMIFLLAACQGGSTAQVTPPSDDGAPQAGTTDMPPAVATDVPTEAPTAAPTDPPTAVFTEAPTEAAAPGGPVSGDPIDVLIGAMRNLTQQSAFRVEQTINSPADGTMLMNVEVIPPGRYRMTSDQFGMMIIDGVTYIQASEDQWVQTGNMGEGFISAFTWINSEAEAEAFRASVTNAEFIGEEELDGETTRHYRYDVNDPTENAFTRNNLWVGADGLPRKLEVVISATVAGESDQGSVINVYKDFGSPDIVIEPPG